MIEKFKELRK